MDVLLMRTTLDTFVVCPCGRTDPAGMADDAGSREYTCGGCGRVYRLTWDVHIDETGKTGNPDLLGHLSQLARKGPNDRRGTVPGA